MKYANLCKDTIKIADLHFSYKKAKEDEKNFLEAITKIQNI